MFEFINYGACFILFVFILIERLVASVDKKKSNGFFIFLVILFIIITFVIPSYEMYDAEENIKRFKKNHTLICVSSTGLHTTQKFQVNNKTWDVNRYYFINKDNSLMIRADYCD